MKALNCLFGVLFFLEASLFAQIQITRRDSIDAIKIAEAQARDDYHSSINKWQQSDLNVCDDRSPMPSSSLFRFSSSLYQVMVEIKYANFSMPAR